MQAREQKYGGDEKHRVTLEPAQGAGHVALNVFRKKSVAKQAENDCKADKIEAAPVVSVPFSSTPALSHFLMWRTNGRSAIRCSMNFTSHS
jgi:hypothetical protein